MGIGNNFRNKGDSKVINIEKLQSKPYLFYSFTGLSVEEFKGIMKELEYIYPEYEKERLSRKDRKNAIGQGSKFHLSLEERVIVLLMYYKLYIVEDLLGFLFDKDKSVISRNISKTKGLIKKVLPLPNKVKMVKTGIGKKLNSIEKFFELYPDAIEIIDVTEQPIQRPKDKRDKKEYYSGKKKRHTIKSIIGINYNGIINKLSCGYVGSEHDLKIAQKARILDDIDKMVKVFFDKGLIGLEKIYPDYKFEIPFKKPRKGVMEFLERTYNWLHSKVRIGIEHVIGKLKRFKILKQEYRNKKEEYSKIFEIIAGIINMKTINKMALESG